MTKSVLITIHLFLLSVAIGIAQPQYPAPTGVYCSCGPTTGKGYGSVAPNIAVLPFVKGILVRIGWELLEPTEGSYNWSLLDEQIAAANTYGKKISLGIGCGIAIPQWVFTAGAERLVVQGPDTIAVPWDGVFLEKWSNLVSAIGARYRTDTTITLVYITNSTWNGYEMQLPHSTTPPLTAVGYTDERMIQSWQAAMDAFNAAFPNHFLTNDFHPVNGSNRVADSVYEYGRNTIGSRYGASAWWWSQKNASNVYPSQYEIIKRSAQNGAFTGVQMVKSGAADSAAFGTGGMPAALQLAMDDNVCYWEVWNQDLLAAEFSALLDTASCGTATTGLEPLPEVPTIEMFPNPSTGIIHITIPPQAQYERLIVFNLIGEIIYQRPVAGSNVTLDLSHLPNGLYIVTMDRSNSILALFH